MISLKEMQLTRSKAIEFVQSSIKKFILFTSDAIKKSKNLAQTNYDLGLYHLFKENFNDAVMRFKIALFFNKEWKEAYYNLGRSYLLKGNLKSARATFEKLLKLDPTNELATFRLNIINKKDIKEVPIQIIEEDSDVEASNDISTSNLSLRESFLEKVEEFFPSKEIDVLDLGCGVGALGKSMAAMYAPEKLYGVDISSKKLQFAEQESLEDKKIYNHLLKADINFPMKELRKKFDIIISYSAFNYICNLRESLQELKKLLKKQSKIIILLNLSSKDEKAFSYESQCFEYSEAFVKKACVTAGYKNIKILPFDNKKKKIICIFS